MKKRAMKKWIPKDTFYCYGHKKTGKCKWHRTNNNKDYQENGYCMYLGLGDWQDNGTWLLWDECKDCGISEWSKVKYRRRDYNE